MADEHDLYEVLGVSPTASVEVIQAAFRALAKKFHPDRNPGDRSAEGKFKAIEAAYSTLEDPARRRSYDDQRLSRIRHREKDRRAQEERAWAARAAAQRKQDLDAAVHSAREVRHKSAAGEVKSRSAAPSREPPVSPGSQPMKPQASPLARAALVAIHVLIWLLLVGGHLLLRGFRRGRRG